MICRICNSSCLRAVFTLGDLKLSGYFLSSPTSEIKEAPITVVLCEDCGLAQLTTSETPDVLYGLNYGYRSGLNASMVNHLAKTVAKLEKIIALSSGDVVLDIGSNDGTLLRQYKNSKIKRIGIDPTIKKFHIYYDKDVIKVASFFSSSKYFEVIQSKAMIVTSLAMFYDVENPIDFAKQVSDVLHPQGIWHLEVSYTPWILANNSYDTICHEHILYFTMKTLKTILDRAGLKIVSCIRNEINGASLAVTVAHLESGYEEDEVSVNLLLAQESKHKSNELYAWRVFSDEVDYKRVELFSLLSNLKKMDKTIAALGASTKGNVLLQASNIDKSLIEKIGEVNTDKVGKFLPGSNIEIVSEEALLASHPDYILILPWHFRQTFDKKLEDYLINGGKIIYPLPNVEIVG